MVGHDWGGGLVVRLMSIRPDLVRSWLTDAAGVADTRFEWHELAKLWQTPGASEAFFALQAAVPAERRPGWPSSPGLGHWWMLQEPARAAAVLEEFRDSIGARS